MPANRLLANRCREYVICPIEFTHELSLGVVMAHSYPAGSMVFPSHSVHDCAVTSAVHGVHRIRSLEHGGKCRGGGR
jgi:hypothetical protein